MGISNSKAPRSLRGHTFSSVRKYDRPFEGGRQKRTSDARPYGGYRPIYLKRHLFTRYFFMGNLTKKCKKPPCKRLCVCVQSAEGIPKGEAEGMLEKDHPIRFPLGPPGESEDRAEGSRRLFAYFLVGEKVGPRRERIATGGGSEPPPYGSQ